MSVLDALLGVQRHLVVEWVIIDGASNSSAEGFK